MTRPCPTCHQVPPCDHLDQKFLDTLEVVMDELGPALQRLAAHDRGDHDGTDSPCQVIQQQ